jgi:ribose-phosphate pyrophosphokinase
VADAVQGEVVVVSPDAGGLKLARRFANCLSESNVQSDLAFIDKRRPKGTHNVAEANEVVGNVAGSVCVLVDDMIDTAGTIVSAANLLRDRGATEVWVAATHGVLSGPAVDRLKNAPIRQVVVTNTLPIPTEKHFDALRVLSIAPVIAEALDAVFEDSSVSEIFQGDNV